MNIGIRARMKDNSYVSTREKDPFLSEKKLWAACMIDALSTVLTPTNRTRKIHKTQDFDWFFSDEFYTGSFLYVCEIFHLSPEAVRDSVLSILKGNKPKPNFRKLLCNLTSTADDEDFRKVHFNEDTQEFEARRSHDRSRVVQWKSDGSG